MTLFEKIIRRDIPAEIVLEDDHLIAIKDIDPKAPVHVLIIPKRMIPRLGEATSSDGELLGRLLLAAQEVAQRTGVCDTGFRIVINHGRDGGETVPHLHVHLLGGRPLEWPPG